ncbi:MAG: hypothetical protein HXY48_13115 [Ignavibacteriaceae bacterium]|nr:hypothetical protein [Ignavibacteriaceae bacterium]
MDPKSIFKSLQIIFRALSAGQIIFFFIAVMLVQYGSIQPDPSMSNIFIIVVAVIAFSNIFVSRFVYKSLVEKDKYNDLEKKMISFRTNNIIRLAFIEGSGLISIVGLIVTGNYIFAGFFIAIFAFFFLNKPTLERFAEDYSVSSSELNKIEQQK